MGLALVDTGAAGPELRQIGESIAQRSQRPQRGIGLALVETGVAGRQQDAELSSPRFLASELSQLLNSCLSGYPAQEADHHPLDDELCCRNKIRIEGVLRL